jgi:hypothetical protein
MPMYVNQSGIVVCINPEMEEKAVRDGLRPVTEEDMSWARQDRSRFALPKVDGYERGEFGNQPIIVCGCGPSHHIETPGLVRIQCNPRTDSPAARFAIALDGIYWNMDMWVAYHERNRHVEYYMPRSVAIPSNPNRCGYKPTPREFNMPVRVIKGQQDDYLEIRTQAGIQKAHFTGIAAVLFAQYLTTGPVILLGFELHKNDAAGANYYTRQAPSWRAAAALWSNVYAHPANTGAIFEFFPKWEG